MNKLARKLSVFALSSVILLANSPIKAGMFAEGQTYNLDAVGKITIDFHQELCDDREYFEFVTDNNKVCVEVGTDDYEVTVYNSAKEQLLHKYDKYEKKTETITQTLVLDILATTLTELAGSDKNQKLTDKHVAEKKPKKANQPVYRKIPYALPLEYHYNYQYGHCACKHTDNSKKQKAGFTIKIGGEQVSVDFYRCPTCLKPIRQTHENNKDCCWRTYCDECHQETEFYIKRGTGDKYVLRCCNRYPFEIHQLEYANTAEFNAAVDSEDIAYICSKHPNHTRGRVYDGEYRVTTCLDCRKAYYYRKCTEYNSTS